MGVRYLFLCFESLLFTEPVLACRRSPVVSKGTLDIRTDSDVTRKVNGLDNSEDPISFFRDLPKPCLSVNPSWIPYLLPVFRTSVSVIDFVIKVLNLYSHIEIWSYYLYRYPSFPNYTCVKFPKNSYRPDSWWCNVSWSLFRPTHHHKSKNKQSYPNFQKMETIIIVL